MVRNAASVTSITLLLTSTFYATLIMPVTAPAFATIYIRSDGSIDPSTAPVQRNGDLYTLTDNIESYDHGIIIERNNMTLDGAGYTLQGPGFTLDLERGIWLTGRSNVTVKNMKIESFMYGIMLSQSTNYNSIVGNNITSNFGFAIYLGASSGISIVANNINNTTGIFLSNSTSITISGNELTNGSGIKLSDSSKNNRISGNNITGVIHLDNSPNNTISGNNIENIVDGILIESHGSGSSNNNTISGNTIINSETGISVKNTSYTTISANNIRAVGILLKKIGILLNNSTRNRISGNNITEHSFAGIHLDNHSNNNTIAGNNKITNNFKGILLDGNSNYNNISGNYNTIANNTIGIQSQFPSGYNTISGNNIKANSQYGIFLNYSSYNKVSGNTMTDNGDGVNVYNAWNNTVDGNKVTNNTNGISIYGEWNTVVENNVESNSGVGITVSTIYRILMKPNFIHHNNLINNTVQANGNLLNVWDNGYPSGGNNWSNHNNTDVYSGPAQNEPGDDGIADNPYVVNPVFSNIDRYPLVNPFVAPIRDVAVTGVVSSKTVVGQGYRLNVNVTLANQGNYTETFEVTAYADATPIASQNITLTSGNSTTLAFTWNTTGFSKGNYTITAACDTVPGETEIADNTFSDGWVYVAMVGDVNADGKVDGKDIAIIAKAFGKLRGQAGYVANADIGDDGKIDGKDIAVAAKYFGTIDP